jgi:glycosyltransferase involved in cell wall biosynthesis
MSGSSVAEPAAPAGSGGRTLSVVHVLPRDLSRGAQVLARELRDRLDGVDGQRHRVVTLFRAPAAGLRPDVALGTRAGPLRRAGLSPGAVVRLRRALAGLRPDVVVAHGGEPLKYCAVARPAAAKLVYYRIGVAAEAGRRGVRRGLQRRLVRSADRVVAISQAVADETVALLGYPSDAVEVIPNGRDPARFDGAGRRGVEPAADARRDGVRGEVGLVFVGHVEAPKRPLDFVEVVRRLVRRFPALRGVVVGDGPLLDEVRRAAHDLPVEVLGRRDDVPRLLDAADVLVSCSEREGMPGVLVEAGLAGRPAVATGVPGVRDVVVDGTTGFVVPAGDVDALVRRTAELVADPALRRRLGAAARDRCLDRFTLDAVATRWSHTLAALVDGSASSTTRG